MRMPIAVFRTGYPSQAFEDYNIKIINQKENVHVGQSTTQ
jgi:hypothetical protein